MVRRARVSRVFAAIAFALAAVGPVTLPAAGPTLAIPEGDILWGFDGTVMRDRFSPLTLVVDNPANEAYDGDLRLFRTDFSNSRVGGFHVESIYLAPATQRIVQFYPYVVSDAEGWVLQWDGGQMTLPKTPPNHGPARVLLADDGQMFERGGAIKRFPARSFPSFVTATDTLADVVLDHAPDWEAPRRQAFLDWLRQGGNLHLLRGSDGRYPEFTSELAVLNEPSDEFRIGAGRVRRHEIVRAELTGDYVRRQLDPPKRPIEEAPEEIERVNQYGTAYSYPLDQWRMTTGVFNQLKRMVKVEHNWGVIHLMSLSYVAVLFPGCFLIGREFRNVPITFGAILGSTLLFGAAFYLIGNRGYGESTNVHAVALAEHVNSDRFDLTQWSSVFAISGGDYAFIHDGEERLYSDATDNEPVGGFVTSGSAGRFVVDVPPYSTRIMAHKTLVRIPNVTPPAVLTAGDPPAFQLPPNFPSNVREAFLLVDRKAWPCSVGGGKISPVGQGQKLREFLKVQDGDFISSVGFWGEDTEDTPDERLTQLVRPLILYSLRLTTDDELTAYYIPEGRAKLYVYAPLAPPLRARSAPAEGENTPVETLPSQTGGVLYSFDLAI
jgi:hypothetical protein